MQVGSLSFWCSFYIFLHSILVHQKVYAEDVPWTSVSNEGERELFQEQSLYSNDRREKILFRPHLKGENMVGKIGEHIWKIVR